MAKIKLDLHDIFSNGRAIEGELNRVIQEAVREKVTRLSVNRLARECAKLDPKAEQAIAEEGMSEEVASWPEY